MSDTPNITNNKMNEQRITETVVRLDGKDIPLSQLQEQRQSLPGNKRIVEIGPNEYKTLSRLQE